ncbi:MAG: hypothetical protein H0X24_03000 [Ktedonobacterales bacterium]|nr:hypothetical protein [Ktedonobacterales bacterium]
MQRFQKSFNAFIEQFQDRWETQPAFRATWSTLGAGTFLIILCVGALVGSNLLGSFFASGGDTTHGSVLVAANGNTSTFPINKLTPQGTDASGTKATPVATSTYSPSPTPTVTPTGPTPVPTDTGTATPTLPTLQVSASQQAQWKVNQLAAIQNFATTPPVANGLMTVNMQFGNDQNCVLTPAILVQLDGAGTYKNQKSFRVPGCTNGPSVTVTYHIDGYQDYQDSGTFVTS